MISSSGLLNGVCRFAVSRTSLACHGHVSSSLRSACIVDYFGIRLSVFPSLNSSSWFWVAYPLQTSLVAIGQTFRTYQISFRLETDTSESTRSARRFGTWTFLAGIVRLYAAYNIDIKELYSLAMWTYGIATLHFLAEWAIFGVRDEGRKYALLVSTSTLGWMMVRLVFYAGIG